MSLLDDPRLTPLHSEDREFIGGLVCVLALLLLSSAVWLGWQGRPLTDLGEQRAEFTPIQIDINQAEWPELALMPGVGEVLGRRIVRFRETHGGFESIDQLDDVKGIGPKVLSRLRPLVLPVKQTTGDS